MRALSLIMHLLSTYYVLVLEIKVIMAQKSLCYGAFFRAVTVRCFHIYLKPKINLRCTYYCFFVL